MHLYRKSLNTSANESWSMRVFDFLFMAAATACFGYALWLIWSDVIRP